MNKDKALRLALGALEKISMGGDPRWADEAIIAIKEALETKDDPVYWEMPDGKIVDKWGLQFYRGDTGTPLYTTPQRKPLTDEQMWNLWNMQGIDEMNQQEAIAFAREIEAAHGIKE
jgi:hypothetical protein